MNTGRWLLLTVAVASLCGMLPTAYGHFSNGKMNAAQASATAPQEVTAEVEASLFVQDPHFKSGSKGISLMWIPQPVLKYCLGKTMQACSTIDYCIRTTNKDAAMCQNLGVDTKHLPAYPAGTTPRRVVSVTLLFPMTSDKGFGSLIQFFENAPKGSLDHLSTRTLIKAKVKLTRTATDDSFLLTEVLSVPSL
jgi:hypothetical protein